MSTYEPGTVAVITVRSDTGCKGKLSDVRGFRIENGWATEFGEYHDRYVTDVRPLVVLDPLAWWPEGVLPTVIKNLRSNGFLFIADAIEAQTRPPKPAEPTVRGAVVRDASGLEWVRVHPGGEAWVNGYQRWSKWDDLDVVEVVRP